MDSFIGVCAGLTILMAILAAIVFAISLGSVSGAADAVAMVVVPYVFTRSIEIIRGK
jgi:hypothetical protein